MSSTLHKDPVCGMAVAEETAAGRHQYRGQTYYFCANHCLEKFSTDPERFVTKTDESQPARPVGQSDTYTCPMDPEVRQRGPGACPKCGMALEPLEVDPGRLRTVYTCPMHPEVERDEAGTCPKCGMALEPTSVVAEEANPELEMMTRRFRVGLVFTIPLLALAMGHMMPGGLLEEVLGARTLNWIQLALATPSSPGAAFRSSSGPGPQL